MSKCMIKESSDRRVLTFALRLNRKAIECTHVEWYSVTGTYDYGCNVSQSMFLLKQVIHEPEIHMQSMGQKH